MALGVPRGAGARPADLAAAAARAGRGRCGPVRRVGGRRGRLGGGGRALRARAHPGGRAADRAPRARVGGARRRLGAAGGRGGPAAARGDAARRRRAAGRDRGPGPGQRRVRGGRGVPAPAAHAAARLPAEPGRRQPHRDRCRVGVRVVGAGTGPAVPPGDGAPGGAGRDDRRARGGDAAGGAGPLPLVGAARLGAGRGRHGHLVLDAVRADARPLTRRPAGAQQQRGPDLGGGGDGGRPGVRGRAGGRHRPVAGTDGVPGAARRWHGGRRPRRAGVGPGHCCRRQEE